MTFDEFMKTQQANFRSLMRLNNPPHKIGFSKPEPRELKRVVQYYMAGTFATLMNMQVAADFLDSAEKAFYEVCGSDWFPGPEWEYWNHGN